MQVQEIATADLVPYERNPRNNDAAVGAVAKSIETFGFKVPIVIDKDNVVVCGHTRLKAAKKLKIEKVPCIIADDLNEEQLKAFRLADNKVAELATWNEDLLELEIADLQLSEIDMSDFGFEGVDVSIDNIDEDAFNFDEDLEEEREPRCHRGEVWKLGHHKLMIGDSTKAEDVRKLCGGVEADCLITDPPYGVALGQNSGSRELSKELCKKLHRRTDGKIIDNDELTGEKLVEFLEQAFNNAAENMKDGAAFYIWYANNNHFDFEIALRKSPLKFHQILVWVKNTFALSRQDYQWRHEPCFYGWKEGAGHYYIDDRRQSTVWEDLPADFSKLTKSELVKTLEELTSDKISTTVLREKKPSRSEIHPTMKPVKLIARHLKNSTKPDDVVLDLFGGSGTTLIASEELGRICYMMEYDERYADSIIERWEMLTGQKAEREE